ncbi:hypothetical protein H6P81_000194 [Aristolochia fimbriata]|uniref:Cytochrome P450 n=1 Tax=Aristolochia fimbriata TaxID=158543 RepID=A0AAV7F772_ARIFI|nr:hypothetical protein H6P81_000194 [Aristolochia fimbriata]
MAFGGGKRICAGALQALLTSCSAIGTFVKDFKWRLAGALQAMLISCSAIGRLVQDFKWRLKGKEENKDTIQLTT